MPNEVHCIATFITEDNFDALQWWKANATQYPVLSKMAMDVYTVQASSVVSESAFFTYGRIIGEYRSSLSADSLCMLTLMKDWFEAECKNRRDVAVDEFVDHYNEQEEENAKTILINYEEC